MMPSLNSTREPFWWKRLRKSFTIPFRKSEGNENSDADEKQQYRSVSPVSVTSIDVFQNIGNENTTTTNYYGDDETEYVQYDDYIRFDMISDGGMNKSDTIMLNELSETTYAPAFEDDDASNEFTYLSARSNEIDHQSNFETDGSRTGKLTDLVETGFDHKEHTTIHKGLFMLPEENVESNQIQPRNEEIEPDAKESIQFPKPLQNVLVTSNIDEIDLAKKITIEDEDKVDVGDSFCNLSSYNNSDTIVLDATRIESCCSTEIGGEISSSGLGTGVENEAVTCPDPSHVTMNSKSESLQQHKIWNEEDFHDNGTVDNQHVPNDGTDVHPRVDSDHMKPYLHVDTSKLSDCQESLSTLVEQRRRICVAKGNHKGEYGYIVRPRGTHFYIVVLDNIPGEHSKKKTSLEFVRTEEIEDVTETATKPGNISARGESEKIKGAAISGNISGRLESDKVKVASTEAVASLNNRTSLPRESAKVKECIECGQVVRFIGTDRKLKGKTGTITGKVGRCYVVTVAGTNETVHKTSKTLDFLESTAHETKTKGKSPRSPINILLSPIRFQQARSPYAPKVKSIKVKSANTCSFDEPGKWRVADSSKGGSMIGLRRIVKMRLQSGDAITEQSFFAHMFQNRVSVCDIPLNKAETENEIEIGYNKESSRYELLLAKVYSDGDAGSCKYATAQCLRTIYVETNGPNLTDLSLEDELLKLADFSSLESPRKVVARLELLYSPLYKFPNENKYGMFFLESTSFCEIPGAGIDGCGFISDAFLLKLLGETKKSAKRVVAIQVRILIPSMGLYKGVLNRKRILSGPPVQLVPSMRKVGPSRIEGTDKRACLMITKNGLHPNSTNEYVHRLVDPAADRPPPKSFKIKPLSDMITRLWRGLGVPKELSDQYVKMSVQHKHLNHAWVVGVADPTDGNFLPPGHVFITGMKHALVGYQHIFVTRSPCILPTDGRMCPIVSTKPDNMPIEMWEDLNSRPFGSIIFASPKHGTVPLPEIIADGDLDGDLYFICWNKEIIQSMKTIPIEDISVLEEDEKVVSVNDNWLHDAQKFAASTIDSHGALIGKLYKLSKEVADESPDGIKNVDAMAFGAAFKDALDFGKHGGQIKLPLHLHEKLPERLWKFLTDPDQE